MFFYYVNNRKGNEDRNVKKNVNNKFVLPVYRIFRYSSDKHRGLLLDIRMNKSCNGTWGRKRCLIGENTYSDCDVMRE